MFGTSADLIHSGQILRAVQDGLVGDAFEMLTPALQAAPFSQGVANVVTLAASRIVEIERERGEISRRERSALAEEAQPYQDFIDSILFAMAGITEAEARGLDDRLAGMM